MIKYKKFFKMRIKEKQSRAYQSLLRGFNACFVKFYKRFSYWRFLWRKRCDVVYIFLSYYRLAIAAPQRLQ